MGRGCSGEPGSGLARTEDAVASSLPRAIEAGNILAAFQRIVEVPAGRTVKLEALARWDDPLLGSVPPAVFVPIAERLGLIGALDRAIFEQACRALADWRGGQYPDLAITVNMSPLTLSAPDLGAEILETIAAAGLPVSSVWIEATESAMVGVEALATIRMLAAAGVPSTRSRPSPQGPSTSTLHDDMFTSFCRRCFAHGCIWCGCVCDTVMIKALCPQKVRLLQGGGVSHEVPALLHDYVLFLVLS